MKEEKRGTLALVVLAIVLALLMLSPMVVHAATPTEEVITEEEFKKRGLKLGTTTYDDGNYITITTVKVITGNPNGSYVVTTEKIPTGGGNCPDRYGYDYDYYYGYGYDDYYYGGYDDYYGYGYGYSRSELREIARDDFADTGIKRLAKKKHGKVTWTVKEVTDYDLVAKITVRNRRNKKKVFYQYTDGEETFFETQSGREIDEDDIKDFLRR